MVAAAEKDRLPVSEDIRESAFDLADDFRRRTGLSDGDGDVLASIIEQALVQERESCAFVVEGHSGFGDPCTIETCAELIRTRGTGGTIGRDLIHITNGRYLELLQAEEIVDALPRKAVSEADMADALRAF